jgi:hypothetical protein
MFRTFYVHHHEEYIVHAALYHMFHVHFMQAVYQVAGCTTQSS